MQLLTNPRSAGYTQNPISVYYCHNAAGDLVTCIAEVTNTPWGAKCSFLFRPEGDKHPKALHVSPFMDMRSQWCAYVLLVDPVVAVWRSHLIFQRYLPQSPKACMCPLHGCAASGAPQPLLWSP